MKRYPWEDVAVQEETLADKLFTQALEQSICDQTRRYIESMHPELLSLLAIEVGCTFMSDLHQKQYSRRLNRLLDRRNGFPIYQYSLAEWQEAIHYITGKNRSVATIDEAVSILRKGV